MSDQRYGAEASSLFHCKRCDGRFLMPKEGGNLDCGDMPCQAKSTDMDLYELSYSGPVASIAGHKA